MSGISLALRDGFARPWQAIAAVLAVAVSLHAIYVAYIGQYVAPGVSLFTIVETGDAWVDANFKETELTNIKPGQTADVVFDVDPDHTYHATVEAIGAGTGAEFSLLPAQNATGNWVKVTQRVPVRLKLDSDHAGLLMRTGLSATVTVDTGVTRHLGDLLGDLKAHL